MSPVPVGEALAGNSRRTPAQQLHAVRMSRSKCVRPGAALGAERLDALDENALAGSGPDTTTRRAARTPWPAELGRERAHAPAGSRTLLPQPGAASFCRLSAQRCAAADAQHVLDGDDGEYIYTHVDAWAGRCCAEAYEEMMRAFL